MVTSVALTCILGGAVGNLVDRLKYGFVMDFVDLHFHDSFHFPPLNLADLAIIVGVVMMFFGTFNPVKKVQT